MKILFLHSLSLLCWTISHNTTLHASSCCLPVLFALRPPGALVFKWQHSPCRCYLIHFQFVSESSPQTEKLRPKLRNASTVANQNNAVSNTAEMNKNNCLELKYPIFFNWCYTVLFLRQFWFYVTGSEDFSICFPRK